MAKAADSPPPCWVYTPTPDGFEGALRECVGLSLGKGPPPRARGPWTEPAATLPPAAASIWTLSF